MALNLELLVGAVKVYGAPLYSTTPDVDYGQIEEAGKYSVVDGSLVVESDAGVMYIPIRRSVLEAQNFNPATHLFKIGGFKALRDASGTYNGNNWAVAQGEVKTFAY
jgi:hypothetical protein